MHFTLEFESRRWHLQLQTVFELYNDKMTGKPNGEANSQPSQLDEEKLHKFEESKGQCECKFVFFGDVLVAVAVVVC